MTSPVRILIVDDEAPQMKAICDILRDHGYETTGFTNGRAALESLRPGQFDLLLSDLMMPGLDGIALLQSALHKDPDIVGIIMTGAGTIATALEAMKSGAFDYLLKPFKVSELLPVLLRALNMRHLRLENAALQLRVHQHATELECKNRELEAFSYSVSHDLRAPLRGIDGFSQILLEDYSEKLDSIGQGHLHRIRAAATRMSRLIDDLLHLSRVSSAALHCESSDLSSTVQIVMADLQRREPERIVEIHIQEGIVADVDGRLMMIVFENLLGNAWKFTSKTPNARIDFFVQQLLDGPVYVVRDNGAGFDMAYAEKLFSPFQRLHTNEDFSGTGIGLATVQRVIDRHGGRIWAESIVGQGATFFFTVGAK